MGGKYYLQLSIYPLSHLRLSQKWQYPNRKLRETLGQAG